MRARDSRARITAFGERPAIVRSGGGGRPARAVACGGRAADGLRGMGRARDGACEGRGLGAPLALVPSAWRLTNTRAECMRWGRTRAECMMSGRIRAECALGAHTRPECMASGSHSPRVRALAPHSGRVHAWDPTLAPSARPSGRSPVALPRPRVTFRRAVFRGRGGSPAHMIVAGLHWGHSDVRAKGGAGERGERGWQARGTRGAGRAAHVRGSGACGG